MLPATKSITTLTLLALLLAPVPGAPQAMSASGPPASLPPAVPASHWGTHGMALFGGKDGLYASHLPMFHAPHDVQVILRLHLLDPALDSALRRQLAARPQLWTLEPEKFDLQRLAPGHPQALTRFSGNLVQGHFERGGKLQYAAQTVIVDQVLVYRPLSAELKQHSAHRYFVIGAGGDHFVVKQIDRRPDFDFISVLQAGADTPLPQELQLVLPAPTKQTGASMQPPTKHAWQAALKQFGGKVGIGKNLYFETGDLQ